MCHHHRFLDCAPAKFHWIDEGTLERRSAALARKRLKGSHTLDVVAGALDDTHCQYRIRGKELRTTTDSG